MKTITNIEKTEKRLLPVLGNALTDSGLFCSDVFLNAAKERFFRVATVGGFLPIAYSSENEKPALTFMKKLCETTENGVDFSFSPRMAITDDLRNSKVLLYSGTPSEFDMPNCISLDMLNIVDLPTSIVKMSGEHGAKFAVLVNPPIDGETSYIALNMLRNIAMKHKLMIFAFIQVSEATDALNGYLANHVSDLCQIGKGTVCTKADSAQSETTDYYYFQYGRPIPQRIIFGIGDNGDLCVPKGLAKLLRVERSARMLIKPVAQSKFEGVLFGALNGEFDKATISSMLSDGISNGILLKTGKGKKAVISKPSQESGATRKPYVNTIAITGLWNRHRKENDYTYCRKSLLRFGETALIIPDEENMEVVCKEFFKGLISAVVCGKSFLDYQIKTPRRNTLIICIGDDYSINEQILNESAKDAKVNVIFADSNIKDAEFVHLLKAEINNHQPDFVFILGFERISISQYESNKQLCNEISRTAKRLGIVTISSCSEPLSNIGDFVDADIWQLSPLFPHGLEEKLIEKFAAGAPLYYSLEATKDKHSFLNLFVYQNGIISNSETSRCRKAYLSSVFYGCINTPVSDILDGITDEFVAEKRVKEAKRLGLIQENNGFVTYIGFGANC